MQVTSDNNAPLPRRHGCLTTWLVLIIIGSVFSLILTPLTFTKTQRMLPHYAALSAAIIFALALAHLVCAVALFQWKKWGFYGVAVISVVALFNNLAVGISAFQSLLGLGGLAILYWVLNMGEDKAWTHLK